MRIFLAQSKPHIFVLTPEEAAREKRSEFSFDGQKYYLESFTNQSQVEWMQDFLHKDFQVFEEQGPVYVNPRAAMKFGYNSHSFSSFPVEFDRDTKSEKLAEFKRVLREAVAAGVSDSDIREAFWAEAVIGVMNT